jgi:phage-related protein
VALTEVIFYQDEAGRAPVVQWLRALRREDRKAYAKCVARIRRLAEAGHELRRPEADYLRDGIYELRARRGRVNYRILYFFHGQQVAILAHALTKEGGIPEADLQRAIRRKEAFEQDPARHTYEEEEHDG